MSEIRLSPDGDRTLRESERLCHAMNVAIQAPEHLLGGALIVLAEAGAAGIPDRETVERAVESIHGRGSEELRENVMPGPGMRQALNVTAGAVAQAGGTVVSAPIIAIGTIGSGEVNPMFFGALGTTREDLEAAVAAAAEEG